MLIKGSWFWGEDDTEHRELDKYNLQLNTVPMDCMQQKILNDTHQPLGVGGKIPQGAVTPAIDTVQTPATGVEIFDWLFWTAC